MGGNLRNLVKSLVLKTKKVRAREDRPVSKDTQPEGSLDSQPLLSRLYNA